MRLALAAALCALVAGSAQAEKFSMIPGVECDREGGICTDERGPSVGLTRLYLGDEAADRLLATLEALDAQAGSAPPDPAAAPAPPPIHSPKPGVSCDDRAQACYTAKGHHNGMTERTYGGAAAQALAVRAKQPPDAPDAIVRPGRREVCDRQTRVCYVDGQPNASLTELHFGMEAAGALQTHAVPGS